MLETISEKNFCRPAEMVGGTDNLTEAQIENLAIMKALPGKYPHAFLKGADNKERPFLILKDPDNVVNIICQKGFVLISGGPFFKQNVAAGKVDLAPIFDGDNNGEINQWRSVEVIIEGSDKEHMNRENMYYVVNDFRSADLVYLKIKFTEAEELYKNDVVPTEITS